MLGALGALALSLLSSCATIDADADFRESARLASERTGIADISWSPDDEALIQATIETSIANGLTLNQAVWIALVNNPELLAALQAVGISRAEFVASSLPPNPTFSFTRLESEVGFVETISLAMSVLDLVLTPLQSQAASARLDAARFGAARHAVDLTFQVREACFRLLALESAERITQEQTDLLGQSVESSRRRLSAGEADRVDVNLLNADLLSSQLDQVSTHRDVRLARIDLALLLGLAARSDELSLVGEWPAVGSSADPQALVEQALSRRLDLLEARARVRAAEEDLSIEGGRVVSDISLGVEREHTGVEPDLLGPTLGVTLPIFHQNQPGIARARFELIRRTEELRAAENRSIAEVIAAQETLSANRELLELLELEVLPLARSSVETALRAYQADRHDLLVLISAQRTLLRERRAYVQTLLEQAIAWAALERAAGGPLEESEPGPEPESVQEPAGLP